MARTPTNFLTETQVGTGETVLTTNETVNTQQVIKSLTFFNQSDTLTITVTVHSRTTTFADTNIIATRAIPPLQTWSSIAVQNKVIQNGQTLSASASVADLINAECDGSLITPDA